MKNSAINIKKWPERMPAPRKEYQCAANCYPSNPGPDCIDCMPVTVHGDPIAARDAEIAELRAALERLTAPRVITQETAQAFMEEALWNYIDCAASSPGIHPDPRIWAHVMAYAPVLEAQIPAALDSYANADQRWVQIYRCSSGDEVLARDVGHVEGWNACRAAMLDTAPKTFGTDDMRDADRWRETLKHVGGTYTDVGAQRFTLRYLSPVEGTDIMKGSVAGHFTAAIDARLAAADATGVPAQAGIAQRAEVEEAKEGRNG